MLRPNALENRLASGDKAFGIWLQSGDAIVAEIVGHLGFNFFIIDNEHGCGSLQTAIGQMRAARHRPPRPSSASQGKTWQALFDEGIDAVATGSAIYCFRVAAAQQMAEWRQDPDGLGPPR